MITQSLNTNLIPGQVNPRINVSQYDKSSRTLSFALYNGSQAFNITSGMTALIEGTKPDGHGFQYNASVTTGSNIVTATLTQQMSCVAGDVICELVINKSGERLATANFVLAVEPAALKDSAIISDSELPLIIALATEQMENSEAWAVGTKNGTAVPSTAPQYHNNAKYYAESIGTYGHDAEAWAIGERGGTPVGSSDPTYHNNSKYYSEQAGTSATNAGNAATRAEASAATAVAASSHPPYIGANGDWYVWNTNSSQYVDSGIDASITVQIADITMLAAGATPYVTNTGTDTDPIFHLFIPRGKGITQIVKTGTNGLVDTYRIDYSDGTSTSFNVTNGKGINTISKTSSSGLVDTYTITYNSGSHTTFTVTNGKTAYQSAVEGGYTGTEAEFDEALAGFELWAQTASAAATNASGSASEAAQSASDAANSAQLAQAYADFLEPHFIIQNNRLYIKDDAVGEFILQNNRLYMKLVS